jgi:hypothetical protein
MKASILFSKPIKRLHLAMIWIVPFVWVLLLKGFAKSAPGSHQVDKKQIAGPFFDVYNSGE